MTRAEKYLLPLALGLLGLSAYVHFQSASIADKNWLLIAAHMLVQGKKLYVDIFEINPPLILWLYALPAWLSEHISFLRDAHLLAITGFAMVACVLAICDRLIRFHAFFADDPPFRRGFILLLAFIFVFFTAPMYFFDREHILLVCTFPYVLRFMPGLAHAPLPKKLRLAAGAVAAIGFCIKPHAVIVFAVLQLLYMSRERSRAILYSLENRIVYVAGLLYLAAIVCLFPEYVHTVLPMALATYSTYSRRINGLFNVIIFLVLLGISFSDFRPRHRSPVRNDIYYFLGVCGAYLAYALANNGWSYTYNPLISMARFMAGWLLMEFIWLSRAARSGGSSPKQFDFGIRSCSLNLLLNMAFYLWVFCAFFAAYDCEKDRSCKSSSMFFEQAKAYKVQSFGTMSLEFGKWSELARETRERWDTRFNHLWMLPKFILSGPDFAVKHRWITDYVGNAYADDLERRKPEVVFIDASPVFFAKQPYFDLIGYYSTVAAFRGAWAHYHRIGVIDVCIAAPPEPKDAKGIQSDCRFDVYGRNTVP